jgi:hypothetical protein
MKRIIRWLTAPIWFPLMLPALFLLSVIVTISWVSEDEDVTWVKVWKRWVT